MMEFEDSELEGVKKHIIDLLIATPDLDEAALPYHLETLGSDMMLEELYGGDMTARLGAIFNAGRSDWTATKAKDILREIMDRLLHKTRRSALLGGNRI